MADSENHPGKHLTIDGVKHTEGYGAWPTCELCGEQVEPSHLTVHTNAHTAALRAK